MVDAGIDTILEEAAFHWFQRCHAANSPGYNLQTLTQIDMRLTGLFRLLGTFDEFIPELRRGFDPERADEYYCLVMAALPFYEEEIDSWIISALEQGAESRSIVAIMGWVDFDLVAGLNERFWASGEAKLMAIALAVWRVHRQLPDINFLQAAQYGEQVIGELLRLAGEMGLVVHQNLARQYLKHESAHVRYWAAYACLMLGESEESGPVIRDCINEHSMLSDRSLEVSIPYLDSESVTPWVNTFSGDDSKLNVVLKTFGVLGVKRFVPWLVGSISKPELAAEAALAFCTMTGMSLDHEEFGDLTVLFADQAMRGSEDIDEACRDLTSEWFNEWWMENEAYYVENVRYLLGRPAHNLEHLESIVADGNQLQRQRAAYEIALQEPRNILFEHRAPGFRQCL